MRPSVCILCVKVKSRGQAISAGKGSPDLTLVPEVSWAPLACIIVYCVHPSGEVINDAIQLPIRQFLQNQVIFHCSFFSLKNKLICLLNCVNMRLWSWKKRWRKNNPSYMIIISQQTFQQWVTVIFSQCLVLVKKKKKKKKRIVEWKLCQCWRNTFALCLVSFFDYLAIRKTSKILYFVKKPKSSWKDNNLQR